MGAAFRRQIEMESPAATAAGARRPASGLAATCAAIVVLFMAMPAHADPVSCANPDNLCRGNPCVTGSLEVISPCVVDFGERSLVIKGTLRAPAGGVLSLKAGSIEVRHPIIGRYGRRQAAGASIKLQATHGMLVRWNIDASARTSPGKIELIAGGNISLLAPLRAAARGPAPIASGGSITVDSGGVLTTVIGARIRATGASTTDGGEVTLKAVNGIQLQSRIRANGVSGGRVALQSSAGNVVLTRPLDVSGSTRSGGSASLNATAGNVTVYDRIDAQGPTQGGTINLSSGGVLTAASTLRADSNTRHGPGGTVTAVSGGDLNLQEAVLADGYNGGSVLVSSRSGNTRIDGLILVAGSKGVGGTVFVSGGLSTLIANTIDADGETDGGAIHVSGGDSIALTPAGGLYARGGNGGSITAAAAAVTVPTGARVLVDGDLPGGSISFDASGGDLVLEGDFRARGHTGGRIEGSASGDVVANGDFSARGSGGCIALMAGSTLDISDGLFDVPVVEMCP
jgi:hypothetical protein